MYRALEHCIFCNYYQVLHVCMYAMYVSLGVCIINVLLIILTIMQYLRMREYDFQALTAYLLRQKGTLRIL